MKLLERRDQSNKSVSQIAYAKTPTGYSAGFRAGLIQNGNWRPYFLRPCPVQCKIYANPAKSGPVLHNPVFNQIHFIKFYINI